MADSFLPFRILGFPQSFTCCIYCCSLFFRIYRVLCWIFCRIFVMVYRSDVKCLYFILEKFS